MKSKKRQKIKAILKLKCPVCLEGPVFKSCLKKHEKCSHCGTIYEREPGYYFGFMYKTYALQAIALIPTIVMVWKMPIPGAWAYRIVLVQFLLQYIPLYRLATVMSLHFDQMIDPRD